MIAWLSLALLASAAQSPQVSDSKQDPNAFEVLPETLEWEQISPRLFDRKWVMPQARTTTGIDLLDHMRKLLDVRFEIKASNGTRYRRLGDLVVTARTHSPKKRQAWHDQLAKQAPSLFSAWDEELRQLLFDDYLSSKGWKPSKDHKRDGILVSISMEFRMERTTGAKLCELQLETSSAAQNVSSESRAK
jgi:hypothetical protein